MRIVYSDTGVRLVLILGVAAVASVVPATPAGAATVGGVPGSTWGVDRPCIVQDKQQNCAEIRATVTVGNTLFIAGDFTRLVEPGTGKTLDYKNLAAINLDTGAPVTSFPKLGFNGKIFALAAEGTTLYVGGAFTKVGGVYVKRLAAFDAANGARVTSFTPKANGVVRALTLAYGKLYVGGRFTAVSDVARTGAAAVDPASGQVDETFNPVLADGVNDDGKSYVEVRTFAAENLGGNPALFLGGHFDTVGGVAQRSVARVDPATGGYHGSFAPQGIEGSVTDPLLAGDQLIVVPSSATRPAGVLLAQSGHSNRVYRWSLAGARKWKLVPDGDPQAIALQGNTLYVGGHFECMKYCRSTDPAKPPVPRMHIGAVEYDGTVKDGQPAVDSWAPWVGPRYKPYYYGVWTLRLVDGDLWAGGAFRDIRGEDGASYTRPKLAVFR